MADLRIVDAPLLSTVKGTEKIPTGGEGNFSVSVNQVADFAKLKWFLATEEYVDNAVGNVQSDLNLHKNSVSNPHQVTKAQVGLGNVDNTADLDKPVSNATQSAIITANSGKADKSYVDSQDQLKADKNTVEASLLLKADKVDLKASKISSDGGQTQQVINDFGGAKWYAKSGGYELGATVKLDNGDTVKSTAAANTANPNVDMTGWKKPLSLNILAFGLKANGTDETDLFQFTYDKASELGLDLDLLGLSFKINKLDINSNSTIKNGSLDLTGYVAPVGWEGNWRRTPIMSKTNPRDSALDFEIYTNYSQLEWVDNVKFKDISFKANWFLTLFYKASNFDFIRCKFDTLRGSCIQFIGGYHATPLFSDTSTEFHFVYETYNPRNKNIRVIDCEGVYSGAVSQTSMEYSSLCRFVACENSEVRNCNATDMIISVHADTYNRGIRVSGGKFKFSERARPYLENAVLLDADVIGVYMGQNSLDYIIDGVEMDDVQRPIYVEGASFLKIKDVTFKNTIQYVSDSYGILVQANIRDQERTKWANCSDIEILGSSTITGYKYPVIIAPAPSENEINNRNITINNSVLKSSSSLPALTAASVENLTLLNNDGRGSLFLSKIGKHNIKGNSFRNSSNFALVATSLLNDIDLADNTFSVDSGALISKTIGTHKLIIGGGALKYDSLFGSGGDNRLLASNYSVIGFVNQKTFNPFIELAAGAVGVYTIPYDKLESTFSIVADMLSEAIYKSAPYNWKFNYKLIAGNGSATLIFENLGTNALSFTATFFLNASPSYSVR